MSATGPNGALSGSSTLSSKTSSKPPKIWWSNAVFFLSVHIATIVGLYHAPPWKTHAGNLWLWLLTWQLADFGYASRTWETKMIAPLLTTLLSPLRLLVFVWFWPSWARVHFRGPSSGGVFATAYTMFTDDPIHDPYAATRGLFHSHMGWIFYKPNYERLELIEKDDLERDYVVQLQHKYYVPLALLLGFVLPPLLGGIWGDPLGGFIYGGLVSRLFIWHCTFLVNSLAHWEGLQPYSDDDTSRGNLILALLTGGEGNHNFHHAFPHDFRSGPSWADWDPSKWIILAFHQFGWAHSLRRARDVDMEEAKRYMQRKEVLGDAAEEGAWAGPTWTTEYLDEITKKDPRRCNIVLDGFVVDATGYLKEHPGGARLLRQHAFRSEAWQNSGWAFHGGLNNHSRAAQRRMRELRIAKLDN